MCLKTLERQQFNTIWVVFGTEQDVDCLLTPKTVSRGQQSLERVCEPRRWNATFANVRSKDSWTVDRPQLDQAPDPV